MTTRFASNRRRCSRRGAMRWRQEGTAARGAVVAAAIVAALALQLAGPRLQGRLADLVGIAAFAPCVTPTAAIAPNSAYSMHPRKVASTTSAGLAPVI